MSECRWTLSIKYPSNEQPFSTIYDPSPYGPKSREEAIGWARGMKESMPNYQLLLLEDGHPLAPEEQPRERPTLTEEPPHHG